MPSSGPRITAVTCSEPNVHGHKTHTHTRPGDLSKDNLSPVWETRGLAVGTGGLWLLTLDAQVYGHFGAVKSKVRIEPDRVQDGTAAVHRRAASAVAVSSLSKRNQAAPIHVTGMNRAQCLGPGMGGLGERASVSTSVFIRLCLRMRVWQGETRPDGSIVPTVPSHISVAT